MYYLMNWRNMKYLIKKSNRITHLISNRSRRKYKGSDCVITFKTIFLKALMGFINNGNTCGKSRCRMHKNIVSRTRHEGCNL